MSDLAPSPAPPESQAQGRDPAYQLWLLWRQGQRPDVQAFLAAHAGLSPTCRVGVLRVDQQERWRAGERVTAETYLQDCAPLHDSAEHALDLVVSEFLLRERLGETPDLHEYAARFPQFAEQLRLQVELHRELESSPPSTGVGAADFADRPTLLHGGAGAAPPLPQVPGYELLGTLGRGGMGVVYKARDRKLKRVVALKMILARGHAGAAELTRFQTEAEVIARLQHPNIVQIHEAGAHDGLPFLSLEFCPGGSLDRRLAGTPLPPRKAAELVETLARAAQAAHQAGILHRDLKPANILLAADGAPKVSDFGLAHQMTGAPALTATGDLLGTPSYMAPEQASGRTRELTPACDVYALGAILYECLTGRPPFAAATALETLEQVRGQEPVPPTRLNAQIPRDLETICLKCLENPPGRRYDSALSLAEELARFLSHRPILARPIGPLARGARWCRRNPAPAALTGAVLLAVLLGVAASSYFALDAHAQARAAADHATTARASERHAREEKQEADRRLYLADMLQAQHAWEQAQVGHLRDLLARQRPGRTGGVDLRGFEWHYWRRLVERSHQIFRGHTRWVRGVAFSPDGRRLASAGSDGVVRLWDAASGREVGRLKGHRPGRDGWVAAVAYCPRGRCLASAGYDGTVRLWEPDAGRELAVCTGHTDGVLALAFSPDGKVLASGGNDNTVRLWDVDAARQTHLLRGHTEQILGLAFSPDGRRLASASKDRTFRVWDTADGRQVFKWLRHDSKFCCVAFKPDGRRLAAAGTEPLIFVFDTANWTLSDVLRGHTNGIFSLAFNRAGLLASTGADHTVRVWDLTTILKPVRLLRGHEASVWSLAFSPDGRRLASAGEDQTVRVWGPDEGEGSVNLPRHGHFVTGVMFSRDGRRLATASGDRTVMLRDPFTGAILRTLKGHSDGVCGVAFSPDGDRLASASYDRTVRIWGADDGRLLRILHGHTDRAYTAAFHPDGRRLLTASRDLSVRVWDVDGKRPLRSFTGHARVYKGQSYVWGNAGCGLALSPDGAHAASALFDRRVLVWEIATGKIRYTLQGHNGLVNGLAFSRDGTRLASGGEDQTVKLWDMATGQEILTLRGHPRPVVCVAFSPDGRRLVSGDADHNVRLWDATPLPAAE